MQWITSSGDYRDLQAWAPCELPNLLLVYQLRIVYLDNDIHNTKSANTYLHVVDLTQNYYSLHTDKVVFFFTIHVV